MNIGELARAGVNPQEMRSALMGAFESVEINATMDGFRFVCRSSEEPRLVLNYEYTAKGKWLYGISPIRSWRGGEIAMKTVGAMKCL